MQLEYTRGYIYLQLFKPYYFINYVFSSQIRLVCLSLLPLKFKAKSYKHGTPGRGKLEKVIRDFKNIFEPLVDSEKETKVGELFKWWRKFRFPILAAKPPAKKTRKSAKMKKSGPMDDPIDRDLEIS